MRAYSHKADPRVPDFPDFETCSVMDANCALCAKGAKWIARGDKSGKWRIIPMQSDLGRALLVHYGLDPEDPTSWLLLDQGLPYSSSDAVIRAGQRLGGVSSLLVAGRIVPRFIRDWAYDTVARNRYSWFGRTDMCAMPDPRVRKRLYPQQ